MQVTTTLPDPITGEDVDVSVNVDYSYDKPQPLGPFQEHIPEKWYIQTATYRSKSVTVVWDYDELDDRYAQLAIKAIKNEL